MKKILLLIICVFSVTFLCACSADIIKNEYNSDETIIADNFKIKIKNVKFVGNILSVNLDITNNGNEMVTLFPDDNFKFFSNDIQLTNVYRDNLTNVIEAKETINYTVSYNTIWKDNYELYFYSGIVENNVKINISSSVINK